MQPEQFLTDTLRQAPWGHDVAAILSAAIQAVDPYQVTSRHLRLVKGQLHLGDQTYPLSRYRRIFLVGVGKAGLPMAQAVLDCLGRQVTDGLVIVKEGYGGPDQLGPVHIREAGHPLPDERGLTATAELLELVSNLNKDDLVLAVISGGGSALLTAPLPGISLGDLQHLISLLLATGAAIGEINRLRTALDQVKGGGLARAVAPASLAALILSDVVGDPLELIASGPTVISTSSHQSPMAVIHQYSLADKLPEAILNPLKAAPPPPFSPSRPNNFLVGNNQTAARGAILAAEGLGYSAKLLTTTLTGEARDVGQMYARKLHSWHPSAAQRPAMWVAGGETTVTLTGAGRGGRNQELALAAVPELDGLEDAALITLATDGGDGPTDAAGAVVTGKTFLRGVELGLDVFACLANNDSHTYFRALGDALMPGPTRTNVNDLLFLFRFAQSFA